MGKISDKVKPYGTDIIAKHNESLLSKWSISLNKIVPLNILTEGLPVKNYNSLSLRSLFILLLFLLNI